MKQKILRLLYAALAMLVCQSSALAEQVLAEQVLAGNTRAADGPVAIVVVVEDARIRLPLPGQSTAVVYFLVSNPSAIDRVLVGVEVEGARRAEMHQHVHADGLMRMRAVTEVNVGAGGSVAFQPHGYHVMAFDFDAGQAPTLNGSYAVTLKFKDGSFNVTRARVVRY